MRIYIQRLKEFWKCTFHENPSSQRTPFTERHRGFAWMFGLNILDSKGTAFYRIYLHVMQITVSRRFTPSKLFCAFRKVWSHSTVDTNLFPRWHTTWHSRTKGSLNTEVPEEICKHPLKIHGSISLFNWLLRHFIHSTVQDASKCFAACWADASINSVDTAHNSTYTPTSLLWRI